MKLEEIRGKDSRELRTDILDLHKELFELRCRAASEEIGNSAHFRQIRRSVAQINTILREREIAEAAKGQQAGDN